MLDPIINLTSPIGGFVFPCFTDSAADVNHILYAAGKANKPDYHFIENVLDGEEIMTAEDDKAVFEEIVKEVVGNEMNTRTLASVYDEINLCCLWKTREKMKVFLLWMPKKWNGALKASGVKDVSDGKSGNGISESNRRQNI